MRRRVTALSEDVGERKSDPSLVRKRPSLPARHIVDRAPLGQRKLVF